jgi:hypothetical protein
LHHIIVVVTGLFSGALSIAHLEPYLDWGKKLNAPPKVNNMPTKRKANCPPFIFFFEQYGGDAVRLSRTSPIQKSEKEKSDCENERMTVND